MGCHFSVVLAGNWVARLVGTFFKHASTLDKIFGIGHRTTPGETNTDIMFEMMFRTFGARTVDEPVRTAGPLKNEVAERSHLWGR